MRAVNRNFMLMAVPAALVLAAGAALLTGGDALLGAAGEMTADLPSGDLGDVEGYAMLIQLLGAGLTGFAGIAVAIVALIVAFYGGVLLLLSAAARLAYGDAPWRLLLYRILTGVHIALLAAPQPELWRTLSAPLPQLCALVLLLPAIPVAITTYSQRIRG